jgi:hypothetical protein
MRDLMTVFSTTPSPALPTRRGRVPFSSKGNILPNPPGHTLPLRGEGWGGGVVGTELGGTI